VGTSNFTRFVLGRTTSEEEEDEEDEEEEEEDEEVEEKGKVDKVDDSKGEFEEEEFNVVVEEEKVMERQASLCEVGDDLDRKSLAFWREERRDLWSATTTSIGSEVVGVEEVGGETTAFFLPCDLDDAINFVATLSPPTRSSPSSSPSAGVLDSETHTTLEGLPLRRELLFSFAF